MVKVIPSTLTLGNLLCGFAAIFYASREFVPGDKSTYVIGHWNPISVAAVMIFIGMVFDALDGRVARMTRQTSEMGAQLDSMADMISFGAAPAFIVIELVGQLVGVGTPFLGTASADTIFGRAVFVISCVYVACAALRLARFNVEIDEPEERDHTSFKGMPSPAAAGTVCSLVLLLEWVLAHKYANKPVLQAFDPENIIAMSMVLITLICAVGMVSTLRYSHVMNVYLRDRAPFHYAATAIFIFTPLLIVPQLTLALGCVLYALSAPAMLVFRKLTGRPTTPARHHRPKRRMLDDDSDDLDDIDDDDLDDTLAADAADHSDQSDDGASDNDAPDGVPPKRAQWRG